MKVLIVNFSDIQGGAAIASYRLYSALRAENVDCQMLVCKKNTQDENILSVFNGTDKVFNYILKLLNQFPVKFFKKNILFDIALISSNKVINKIRKIKPDIVHLHWVNGGMLSIDDLKKIKKPLVWSMHDMWLFTGGCHYDEGCGRYINHCGLCKVLSSSLKYDLSSLTYYRKKKIFKHIDNITIIALSRWLMSCAESSSLLKEKNIMNLSNLIDVEKFKPMDRMVARELWGLPFDKKLILFSSISSTGARRKGLIELVNSLSEIANEKYELVIIGDSNVDIVKKFGINVHFLGKLYDDVSLITIYNAVDLFVIPSLQENLSNAIMESLSCGTPVVGFNIGGNSDMVSHKESGYLANPGDSIDLAKGIKWVLNSSNYEKLCENCRKKVNEEFSSSKVVYKYISLYNELLDFNAK